MAQNTGQDMRRYHRLGVALQMTVQFTLPDGSSFTESTSSDDVSRGGCSFRSSHRLELGTPVDVEIMRRSAARRTPAPFVTQGVVLRVIDGGPEGFLIGIKFTGAQFPTFSSEGAPSS
jgi:hypothetical protein